MTTSPGVSDTANTRKPGSPNSASARPIPSSIVRGLLSSQPSNSRNDGETPGPRGGSLPASLLQREEPVNVLSDSDVPYHAGSKPYRFTISRSSRREVAVDTCRMPTSAAS